MEMPLAEVVGRYSILKLKIERLKPKNKEQKLVLKRVINKEFEIYNQALEDFEIKGVIVKPEWIEKLYEINGRTWDLEADIRQGKEGLLGLEEVGRRALKIRDINTERIEMKNLITKESGSGYFEIKINHASSSRKKKK